MDIKNYLQEFRKMVDELKAHPKVRLLSFHAFEPALESDIEEVETHLGFALDEDLKTFYRQCNGLQLRWAHLDNPGWDRKELTGFVPGPFTYQDVLDDAGTIDGCVNILPIREVFLTDWVKRFGKFDSAPETVAVGDIDFSYGEFNKAIRILNLYHVSVSEAMLCSPRTQQVVVGGMGQHQVFIRSYRYTTRSYFDLLLKGKGSISFCSGRMDNKKGLVKEMIADVAEIIPFDLKTPLFSR
ncbi:MAG: SMI1/KNR4 family protein [Bacteroidetes bacterium]|nr:SMI1/KNR4 family protein [Bacteroidota bacterium]